MRTSTFSLTLLFILASAAATARDDHKMFPLEDALNTPAAKEKLDPNVKFYFGKQSHPKVVKVIGEWSTNKKTNAFNKSDKEACEWAFLSAMLTLEGRARSEGGNAIINIRSNYKNIETSSDTEYMCGAGTFVAGVAFKGEVVKLAK
jgi:uncharacterized protein YbjQ (UPF0145 family)